MASDDTNYLRFGQHNDFGDPETLRLQADQLQVDMTVDIDKLAAFASPEKIDISAVAGKLGPADEGLVTSTDFSTLDDGLRRLREREADSRLRRLVEQAQQKMAEKKFHTALNLLGRALEIDRTDAFVLFLEGWCYFEVGKFDRALDFLNQAREHARDSETIMLVVALRAACHREITKKIGSQLIALLNGSKFDAAMRLVEAALQVQPDNAILLYNRCVILFRMNRLAEVKSSAEAALAVVGRADAQRFHDLLQEVIRTQSASILEAARHYLRGRHPKKALGVLADCGGVLDGDQQFEALRSYAHERFAQNARTALTRRRRTRQADVPPLKGSLLQSILCWLLREELKAGFDSLSKADSATADRHFRAAEEIDDRCNIIAYMHAVAILRGEDGSFSPTSAGVILIQRRLERAAQLARQVTADPSMRPQGLELTSVINSRLRSLAVDECVLRFDRLLSYYNQNPISNRAEARIALNAFVQIGGDAQRLRMGHPVASENGQMLHQLENEASMVVAQIQLRMR